MSNLQVLARRCPVMGKALTVQAARVYASRGGMLNSVAFGGAVRGYHGRGAGIKGEDRKGFHSARAEGAQAVDVGVRGKTDGRFN
jgi:5-aminolevulinate synthase